MKKMSIFALLLAAVVVTSYSVSGTYAKYTSTFNGTSDTARVAKWAFKVDGQPVSNTFDFNLFNTVVDTVDGNTDADVAAAGQGENAIIAPGTKGQITVALNNDSEVNAKYEVNYEVDNTAGIPVEFSVDGNVWKDNIDALDFTEENAKSINKGATADINLYWRWVYEVADNGNGEDIARDTKDTDLGIANSATITVTADVTVTQVD